MQPDPIRVSPATLPGKQPRPKQPPEFWDLLDALYEVHGQLERLAAYRLEVTEECSRLERLVLLLQEVA